MAGSLRAIDQWEDISEGEGKSLVLTDSGMIVSVISPLTLYRRAYRRNAFVEAER
jgi:hypothetical protein